MYITYHIDASFHGEQISVPHKLLNEEVQRFIEEKKEVQKEYSVGRNKYYVFISLLNGNRIDVSL